MGRLKPVIELLQAHGAVDAQLNWTFGRGELIVLGDVVNSGEDVAATLWFLRKLQAEARAAGGQVTQLLGDQEAMFLSGDWPQIAGKYHALAEQLTPKTSLLEARLSFIGLETSVGNSLRQLPVLVKRGEYLFVHGGLHPEILSLGLGLESINSTVERSLALRAAGRADLAGAASFLLGAKGPLRYSGLVRDLGEDGELSNGELTRMLAGFDATRVVVGHSPVADISIDYAGRVIRIGTNAGELSNTTILQGLLLLNGEPYRIDATGNRSLLD